MQLARRTRPARINPRYAIPVRRDMNEIIRRDEAYGMFDLKKEKKRGMPELTDVGRHKDSMGAEAHRLEK